MSAVKKSVRRGGLIFFVTFFYQEKKVKALYSK
jgi:hypothetical protein